MKNTLVVTWVFVALAAFGADLHLQDGTVLKNAHLSRRRGDSLTVLHSRGGGTFKLSDFTRESQAWFEGKHGRRSFDGGMHFATDEQYRLANELVKQCSDSPRFRVALVARLDQSHSASTIAIRVRKEVLCRLYASELTEEELTVVVHHMKSPLFQKARRLEPKYRPQLEKILEDHLESHPEYLDAFKDRLKGKSKQTGQYYHELDKIASEILSRVSPQTTHVLEEYFTPGELDQFEQIESTPAFQRLERISMMAELILPRIVMQYLKEEPDDLRALIELTLQETEHNHAGAQQPPERDK